nr:MAG TPA: hypothetical protein [Caudoviricetes sp.]
MQIVKYLTSWGAHILVNGLPVSSKGSGPPNKFAKISKFKFAKISKFDFLPLLCYNYK